MTIEPPGAISAGARWQMDGGAYQDSGITLSGLSPGDHIVAFKPVGGYILPPDRSVTITADQTTTTTGIYQLIATGSLKVTIKPAGAISAGAQWQVDGGAYQNSGTKLSGVSAGTHTVTFKPVTGYVVPANQSVTISASQTTTTTGTYVLTATGSLKVTIKPAGAISAGAQWQVDDGAYQNSGTKLSGLSTGAHTVTFKPVIGYTLPPNQSVTVVANQTTTTTGAYLRNATGSLIVTIAPAGAISAGAQWQVDDGAYQNSGTKLSGLATGDHVVTFKPVGGYILPVTRSVTIIANQTTTTTGTYTLATGSIQVTIAPPGAIAAGAQWQINGYPFQDSGTTLSGLYPGTYPIIFKGAVGYTPPPERSVTVVADQTATTTGTYVLIPTGSIQVTIAPPGAIAAGAQWQINGYPFQDSGTTLSGLYPGTYPIIFKGAVGYTPPPERSVTVVADQTATTTGTYVLIPTGSIQVTIAPPGAIAAGAQWQINGYPFQDSGTTLSGLYPGNYPIIFKGAVGYTPPPERSVTVVADQTATTTGTYVAYP